MLYILHYIKAAPFPWYDDEQASELPLKGELLSKADAKAFKQAQYKLDEFARELRSMKTQLSKTLSDEKELKMQLANQIEGINDQLVRFSTFQEGGDYSATFSDLLSKVREALFCEGGGCDSLSPDKLVFLQGESLSVLSSDIQALSQLIKHSIQEVADGNAGELKQLLDGDLRKLSDKLQEFKQLRQQASELGIENLDEMLSQPLGLIGAVRTKACKRAKNHFSMLVIDEAKVSAIPVAEHGVIKTKVDEAFASLEKVLKTLHVKVEEKTVEKEAKLKELEEALSRLNGEVLSARDSIEQVGGVLADEKQLRRQLKQLSSRFTSEKRSWFSSSSKALEKVKFSLDYCRQSFSISELATALGEIEEFAENLHASTLNAYSSLSDKSQEQRHQVSRQVSQASVSSLASTEHSPILPSSRTASMSQASLEQSTAVSSISKSSMPSDREASLDPNNLIVNRGAAVASRSKTPSLSSRSRQSGGVVDQLDPHSKIVRKQLKRADLPTVSKVSMMPSAPGGSVPASSTSAILKKSRAMKGGASGGVKKTGEFAVETMPRQQQALTKQVSPASPIIPDSKTTGAGRASTSSPSDLSSVTSSHKKQRSKKRAKPATVEQRASELAKHIQALLDAVKIIHASLTSAHQQFKERGARRRNKQDKTAFSESFNSLKSMKNSLEHELETLQCPDKLSGYGYRSQIIFYYEFERGLFAQFDQLTKVSFATTDMERIVEDALKEPLKKSLSQLRAAYANSTKVLEPSYGRFEKIREAISKLDDALTQREIQRRAAARQASVQQASSGVFLPFWAEEQQQPQPSAGNSSSSMRPGSGKGFG